MQVPKIIGLDADDTLWHNLTHFQLTHERFNTLLAPWGDAAAVEQALADVEQRNLLRYGYGAKGFTLSMLETALELSQARIDAGVLAEILAAGRELMQHPVDPLPGVPEALQRLSALAPLVLITKGDMFHQESKLAASGLGAHFSGVEIVSEKTADTYHRAFARHGVAAGDALMAGNSVRSDILPALQAGSAAVLIPYPLEWAHEAAQAPQDHPRYRQFDSLAAMADWLLGGAQ